MKKNFRIIEDNHYSSIEETKDEVDNYYVFKTLPQAKKALINNMKQSIANFKSAIKRVRTITKDKLYGDI